MNENYCIWDFEEAHGVNWDEVYTTFLPQFEALDARQGIVTDDELEALYCQFLDSLHDGHMDVQVLNFRTGKYLRLTPNENRNLRERGEQLRSDGANVTPVSGTLPKFVFLYGDELEIKEGHGFDPDKDLPLDVNLFQSTGRDNQLEAALDYIHNK